MAGCCAHCKRFGLCLFVYCGHSGYRNLYSPITLLLRMPVISAYCLQILVIYSTAFSSILIVTPYDTVYVDSGLQDDVTYNLYIRSDSLVKTIHIYGDKAPYELLYFGEWLASVKNTQLQFVETDMPIAFDYATDVIPPPLKVDSPKFTPPAN